ncbi:RNA-binding protein [bacterium]|nr:RNA-binding protein [bacterium]
MKLFVGNLPFSASEEELKAAFVDFGAVDTVKIIIDKFSGRSRGFGFVEMPNDGEAQTAITQLHDRDFKGRKLIVNEAKPRPDRA